MCARTGEHQAQRRQRHRGRHLRGHPRGGRVERTPLRDGASLTPTQPLALPLNHSPSLNRSLPLDATRLVCPSAPWPCSGAATRGWGEATRRHLAGCDSSFGVRVGCVQSNALIRFMCVCRGCASPGGRVRLAHQAVDHRTHAHTARPVGRSGRGGQTPGVLWRRGVDGGGRIGVGVFAVVR